MRHSSPTTVLIVECMGIEPISCPDSGSDGPPRARHSVLSLERSDRVADRADQFALSKLCQHALSGVLPRNCGCQVEAFLGSWQVIPLHPCVVKRLTAISAGFIFLKGDVPVTVLCSHFPCLCGSLLFVLLKPLLVVCDSTRFTDAHMSVSPVSLVKHGQRTRLLATRANLHNVVNRRTSEQDSQTGHPARRTRYSSSMLELHQPLLPSRGNRTLRP